MALLVIKFEHPRKHKVTWGYTARNIENSIDTDTRTQRGAKADMDYQKCKEARNQKIQKE